MGNGWPHDNPITDGSNHRLIAFPSELEGALRALHARGRLGEIGEIEFERWRAAAKVVEEATAKIHAMLTDRLASPQ